MVEATVEFGRPFAACAYEKTGGGGAPSPVGLDEVEAIVDRALMNDLLVLHQLH
jgi:hypothetical protein